MSDDETNTRRRTEFEPMFVLMLVIVAISAVVHAALGDLPPMFDAVRWYIGGVIAWLCVFTAIGYILGVKRNAAGLGAVLGLLLGPLGVLITLFLDKRPDS